MRRKLKLPMLRQERSMKCKLFGYMLLLVVVLLLVLLSALLLFGGFGSARRDTAQTLGLQMEVFEKDMAIYWDNLAARSISLSDKMAATVEARLDDSGIPFSELTDNADAIADLQEAMLEPLCQYLRQANCSGAFVLLDATVNNRLPDADLSRCGLYVEKSSTDDPTCSLLLYRGIAEIGRTHNVMPHRKWRQEFRTDLFPDYETLIADASLPPEEAFRLSSVITLPGTSEQVALLTVPLVGSDGTCYGLCGFEVSQSWFKAEHAQPTNLSRMLCLFTEGEAVLNAAGGFSAGIRDGYYIAPNSALQIETLGDGLMRLKGTSESYVGMTSRLAVSESQPAFTLAVMMPKGDYDRILQRNNLRLAILILLVSVLAVICCLYFSRRFLSPILRGLAQIRTARAERVRSEVPEIDDLLCFLSEKDRETECAFSALELEMEHSRQELTRLQEEYADVCRKYEAAQVKVRRLSDGKMNEVDAEEYRHFLDGFALLTAREREILDLYTHGKNGRDILPLVGITENTLKFHNRNIYSKLGVRSRKQLLLYLTLMERENSVKQ